VLEPAWQNRVYSSAVLVGNQVHDFSKVILEAPTDEQGLWNQLAAVAKLSKNFEEVLHRFCADKSPTLFSVLNRMIRGYEGTETKNLSAKYISSLFLLLTRFQSLAVKQSQGEPVTFSLSHVKGGNSTLIEALEKKLKGNIYFDSPLKRITKNDERIQLHFAGREPISAERIVLTLPCSTLRDVSIDDGIFPEDQIKAIRTLQYGTNGKIILPVQLKSKSFPEVASGENFFSWFNHDHSLLILYYGGAPGIFSSTPEEIRSKLKRDLKDLRLIHPTARFPKEPEPIGISWIHEEFSKGSYSNLAPGTESFFQEKIKIRDQDVKKVFRPKGSQIFFAGEHTSINFPGSLEGAVESGEKA